jgi:elongator complex protein 2
VSGADEKLLRVFNEPKEVAHMLQRLCGIEPPVDIAQLPDTAVIPVLGLSNKAMDEPTDDGQATEESIDPDTATNRTGSFLFDIDAPPTEDLLARHTLWPEHEKLYGHGYEISTATAPFDGNVLATACKASSIDHAVIRLYDTTSWNEIKPPLAAHSLTVTKIAVTLNAEYLLTVGRDRQWAVFKQDTEAGTWGKMASNTKAHSRMILDCTWLKSSPGVAPAFVTAGRDKTVKVWSSDSDATIKEYISRREIKRQSAVTAIAVADDSEWSYLAIGEDDGAISVHVINHTDDFTIKQATDVDKRLCPSKTVNRLAWCPGDSGRGSKRLAVASADGSLRVLRFNWEQILTLDQ